MVLQQVSLHDDYIEEGQVPAFDGFVFGVCQIRDLYLLCVSFRFL